MLEFLPGLPGCPLTVFTHKVLCLPMSSRTADFLWAVTMETKILHMGATECNLPEVEDGTSCVTLSDISCPSCQCVLAAALLDLCLLPPPNLVLLSLDAETSL